MKTIFKYIFITILIHNTVFVTEIKEHSYSKEKINYNNLLSMINILCPRIGILSIFYLEILSKKTKPIFSIHWQINIFNFVFF